jgi:hypothetical protein
VPKIIDITGQRFGSWTVLARGDTIGGHPKWLCRCDCGTERQVIGYKLRNGTRTNCGCQHQPFTKHGAARLGKKTRLYVAWMNMRHRCHDRNRPQWKDYGGRGITICPEWQAFGIFRDWALSHGYADNLTIDRVDNDLGYSPGNCRWATRQEQAANQRTTKLTVEQVRNIRVDPRVYRAIAADYGVSRSNIKLIKNGKAWVHVT